MSDETKKFFGLINDTTIHIDKVKDYEHLFDVHKITDHQKELKSFLQVWNGVGDVSTAYQNWMVNNRKATSDFSATASKTGSLLEALKPALALNGIEAAASVLINTAAELFISLEEKEERAAEKAKAIGSSLNNFYQSFSEGSTRIDELSVKYQELSKGVSDMGANISLTDQQYTEYKNTVQELSELMPHLNALFNEQGEKIAFVGGRIQDAREQYNNAIRSQAQNYLRNGDDDGNTIQDILDDFNYSSETDSYGWSNLWRDAVNAIIKGKSRIFLLDPKTDYGSELFGATPEFSEQEQVNILNQLVNTDRAKWSDILNDSRFGDSKEANLVEELLGIDVDKVSDMSDEEYAQVQRILSQKIKGIEQTLSTKAGQVTSAMNSMLLADDDFWSLEENTKSAISSMISGLNSEALADLDIDLTDQLSVETWVAGFIDDINSNKNNVADAVQNLFSLNTNELSPSEAKSLVHSYISTIADELYGSTASIEQIDALKESFHLDHVDTDYDKFQKTLTEHFNAKKTKKVKYIDNNGSHYGEQEVYDSERSQDLNKWSESNKVTQKELNNLIAEGKNAETSIEELDFSLKELRKKNKAKKASFSSFWNGLSKPGTDNETMEEKNRLLKLARSGKLTTKEFSNSSLAAQIMKDTGLSAESATMKINRQVKDTGRLNTMRNGLTAINAAYDEKRNSDKRAVSKPTLNSMRNTLGISEWDAAGQQAWENYVNTAGDSSKSTEELREAQDRLAKSYINSNNFLLGLDKSNESYYKTLLKETGIMNVESLVAEQLAKNLKQAREAKLEPMLTNIDISDPMETDIQSLKKEANYLGFSNEELAEFLTRRQQISETGLYDVQSISTLVEFCHKLGIVNKEMKMLLQLKRIALSSGMKDSQGISLVSTTGSQWGQKDKTSGSMNGTTTSAMIQGAIQTEANSTKKRQENNSLTIGEVKKGDNYPKGKSSTSKTKQEIDWISRRLAVLQSRIDLTKARFENLFSLKTKKNNLNTQISQTTKLLRAQEKSAAKYEKKANGIKISKNKKTNKSLKEKVKEGAVDGKTSRLIHSYDGGTAKKITSYQNYIDKVKEARKATEELRHSLKDLNKQKLDLALEHNETKRSYKEAKYSNAASASAKNKLLDDEISIYQSDDKAYNTYYKKAKRFRTSSGNTALSALKKSGLKKGTKKKIKNLIKKGKEIPDTLLKTVKKNNSSLYNKLIDYNNNVDYVSDVLNEKNTAKEEAKASIRDKRMQKIENIQKHYENRIGKLNDEEQGIQNKADLMEARGQTLSAGYYQSQNKYEQKKRQEAVNEKNAVQRSLDEAMAKGDIKIYSDEWYEIQSTLQTLDNTINDCDIAIANNSSAIRELHTAMLDKMAEDAARSNTEADFMATLLSHQELTDSKTGDLTDSGLATLGTYGINYSTSKAQRENFNQERRILDKMKESETLRWGDGSHDYDSMEQLEEAYKNIIDRQQEWAKSEFDAEQKIIDLMKSKYQAQLDYMNRIIDARKNVLNMEKDLYDYQRNIADKTKNISTLEKQLSALQGDDSEEGRARRSKLQTSLDEANMDLQDTEYDKYISDQQNMLDNMSSQYEDLLSSLFRDTDTLLQNGLTEIRTNGSYIQGILNKKAEDYGYSYSETFGKIVECLTEIGTPSANPPSGNSGAEQNYNARQNASHSSQPADSPLFPSMQQQMSNAEQSVRNAEVTQLKSFLAVHSGKADTAKPLRPAKSNETFSSELNQKLSKYGYVVKSGSGSGGLKYINMFAQILGDLSGDGSYQANGKVYKALSKKYPHVGFRTGGIIRASGVPSDGDRIAIRVNPNETILTQDFTKLLPDAVNMMQQFTRPVSIPGYLQNMKSLAPGGSTSIGSVNLSLDLPNVENSKDFITELQNNRKIQRALEISISDCIRNGRITSNIQSVL